MRSGLSQRLPAHEYPRMPVELVILSVICRDAILHVGHVCRRNSCVGPRAHSCLIRGHPGVSSRWHSCDGQGSSALGRTLPGFRSTLGSRSAGGFYALDFIATVGELPVW